MEIQLDNIDFRKHDRKVKRRIIGIRNARNEVNIHKERNVKKIKQAARRDIACFVSLAGSVK